MNTNPGQGAPSLSARVAAIGWKRKSANGYFAAAQYQAGSPSVSESQTSYLLSAPPGSQRRRSTSAFRWAFCPIALRLSSRVSGGPTPYGPVADAASADRVAASRLARASLHSFGSSSRSSRTETR